MHMFCCSHLCSLTCSVFMSFVHGCVLCWYLCSLTCSVFMPFVHGHVDTFVHWHICVNAFVHWQVPCSCVCSQTCSVLMPLFTDMFYDDSRAHWHVFAVDAFVQEHVTVHTTRREWTVKPVARDSLVMLFMPEIAQRKVSPFPFPFCILFLQEIWGQEIIGEKQDILFSC